ncbi:MAG TPA: YciI family protein [Rhodothermales bacterium]|nr:YciI family protein [Rhodothermales bacterium]
MLFIVRFTDRPDTADIRALHLPAHLDWLDAHAATVLVAGSLRPDADAPPVGGLWIVEAESREAVDVLIGTDPFWVHGLRAGVEVLLWSKARPDRQALV